MMGKITPASSTSSPTAYSGDSSNGAGDAKRITDKLLTNYFFVGLIHLLFPKAKIIHTRRDPVDTCLSGFTKLFKDDMPHSYDLGELGRYYGKYRELMEHWREGAARGRDQDRPVRRCRRRHREGGAGADRVPRPAWDRSASTSTSRTGPVKTASVAQVRKPIYKTAVKRWKKYGAGLQPLVDAIEGKAGKAGRSRKQGEEKAKETA